MMVSSGISRKVIPQQIRDLFLAKAFCSWFLKNQCLLKDILNGRISIHLVLGVGVGRAGSMING